MPVTSKLSKKKDKFTHIEFPVFHYCIHVEFTSDLKKALQKYPQTKDIDLDEITDYALTVHDEHDGASFIFLPWDCSIGVIVHESWHAIRRMMSYINSDFDNEVIAYHLGYLVDEIIDFVG
jgi:hypothetical protein